MSKDVLYSFSLSPLSILFELLVKKKHPLLSGCQNLKIRAGKDYTISDDFSRA